MNIKYLISKTTPVFLIVIGTLLAGGLFLALAQSSVSDTSSTFYSPVPQVGAPQIRLTKAVNVSNPTVGDEIIYTLTYENLAPGSEAFNVRLYEFLPPGTQYLSAVPAPSSYKNGTLVFDRASIGPSTDPVEVTVRVRVLAGYRQLYNYSMLTADGLVPPHVVLRTDVTQPASSLKLEKIGYSAALTQSELIYTLRVENISSASTDNATLVDVLPAGVSFVSASPMPDDMNSSFLSWSLGTLSAGASRTVVLTATAPAAAGVITNTAFADSSQTVMTNTLFSTQVVSQGAILRVRKSASAPEVRVGDQLVYTIHYENAGNLNATGVVLTDTFPADITVDGTDTATSSLTNAQGVWPLGTIAPNVSGQIVVTTTVGGNGGRTLLNVVDIAGQPVSFPDHFELSTEVKSGAIYLPIVMKQ